MLLALDVGNTNVTVGAFEGKRLARQWRQETRTDIGAGILGRDLASAAKRHGVRVDSAVYGSVVPGLNRTLEEAVRQRFGCRALAVTPRSRLGMRLKVKTPLEVGADRILNALAAFELAKGPAVVIDFGTATTFDCVSKRGDYLGGAILPGPRMAAKALASGTAQLPEIAVRRPRRVIGRNTKECIEAGLYFGYLGMIERILGMTLAEMKRAGSGPRIVSTRLLRSAARKSVCQPCHVQGPVCAAPRSVSTVLNVNGVPSLLVSIATLLVPPS